MQCITLFLKELCFFFEAEEGIEIEDRVAFACKYLPDKKVCCFKTHISSFKPPPPFIYFKASWGGGGRLFNLERQWYEFSIKN